MTTEQASELRAAELCPTCAALGRSVQLIRAGERAWICPNQATEGNGISAARRASIRATINERVPGLPF